MLETKDRGLEAHNGDRQIAKMARFLCDLGSKGTFGGTSASISNSLRWSPPAGSIFSKGVWTHPLCHAYSTFVEIYSRVAGSILVFFQYHKDGFQHSLLQLIAKVTKTGHRPFILLADFNCTPDELIKLFGRLI